MIQFIILNKFYCDTDDLKGGNDIFIIFKTLDNVDFAHKINNKHFSVL